MRTATRISTTFMALCVAACVGAPSRDRPAGDAGAGGMDPSGEEDPGEEDGGNEVFDVANGDEEGGDGEDGDLEGCDQDVDIVFVMDVSTSMGPFLSKLADEIVVVDAALQALHLPTEPRYGLALFVDDKLIENGGDAYGEVYDLKDAFQTWSAFTSSNLQISGGNPNTTWPENSMDALFLAATEFDWRPMGEDTLRMVIHTTDDTFWDGPTVGNGETVEHGWDDTVAALQDAEVRVFSFADQIGGQFYDQDVSPGWFGPWQGKPSMGDSTDGGVFFLPDVLNGQVSLADAIKGWVEENLCEPYVPQG